ncbi:RNA polymerase sigma factor [Rhizobium halophytocola]|uniref:RNA polymerase sigma-70 factor (ECF subfamily) n=1 Tax=Rhizobium halophytocola TaxID=735519 RepID=A0ABS4DXS9_9HYPH|nr:RNA polymerase sigma-70 factor (ECF subfamily) [Rhizobium halophytocola]
MTNRERVFQAYLVSAARLGDRKAMERLAEMCGPRLLAHAGRLLDDRQSAEDVVQSAWIDILHGLPRLADDRAFMPWALRIVSRRVVHVIRRRQRQRRLASQLRPEAPESATSQGPPAADAATIRALIDRLDAPHRATLALFYLEDLSVAEVAVALDIPAGTVKSRLTTARHKLRAFLKGETDEQDR